MSSKRKFFLIFCFCMLDAFLLVGFCVIRDATLFNALQKEEEEILKLGLTNSNYRQIQSRGDYAIVEKAIKDYLRDYSTSLRNVLSIMDDEKLVSILSYDNYCQDGPEFQSSIAYLKKQKQLFNEEVNVLLSKSEDVAIIDGITKRSTDSYSTELYKEFMMSVDMNKQFTESREFLQLNKIRVNNIFDVSMELLNFLAINKDSWKVEEGEIRFVTQDLYNQYMSYISKLS